MCRRLWQEHLQVDQVARPGGRGQPIERGQDVRPGGTLRCVGGERCDVGRIEAPLGQHVAHQRHVVAWAGQGQAGPVVVRHADQQRPVRGGVRHTGHAGRQRQPDQGLQNLELKHGPNLQLMPPGLVVTCRRCKTWQPSSRPAQRRCDTGNASRSPAAWKWARWPWRRSLASPSTRSRTCWYSSSASSTPLPAGTSSVSASLTA